MKAKGRIKRYLIFTKAGFQTLIAYRGAVLLWTIGSIISATLMGLLWWAIFSFSENGIVGGFTYPQMLLYVILSTVVGQVASSSSMGTIVDDVRDGQIGMRLMKPISYRLQLCFSSIGESIGRMLIVGLPAIIIGTLIAVFGFGLTGLKWYNIILFFPACFLALLINEAYDFLFGQLAFRTQAMFGVSWVSGAIKSFLSGGMIPLTVFPTWAQRILGFTPFPFMVSMSVRIFLGVMSWTEMLTSFAIAIAWIVALNIIGALMYKTSVRKVVVFGG